MNIVDSSGWLEYLTDGLHADTFSEALLDVDSLIVPTISLYEVFKVVLREHGEDEAIQAIALMQQGLCVDLTADNALFAAKLSLEHALPMADSIIYTTAQLYEAIVWTLDEDFEGLAGVRYFGK